MKKLIIFCFTFPALFISSCMVTSYYQVYKVTPENQIKLEDDYLVFEDENCRVSYNLWSENGNIGFIFYNKTEQSLYLSMEESFYYLNGVAFPYYQGRTVNTTGGSLTPEVSSIDYLSLLTGNVQQTTMVNSRNISYSEAVYIIVPPGKSRIITEFNINNSRLLDCGLYKKPTSKQINTLKFSNESSPYIFGNILSYTIGRSDELITFENNFYVSEVTNYPSVEIIKLQHDELCGEELETSTKIFSVESPDRFYIKYTPTGFSKY